MIRINFDSNKVIKISNIYNCSRGEEKNAMLMKLLNLGLHVHKSVDNMPYM